MKLRLTLKSGNLVPFFHVPLVKIAKIKPREILSRQNLEDK